MVDDNEFNIYTLNIMLTRLGFETDSTNNGKTAIDMVVKNHKLKNKAKHYKLIFMDCNMEIMNGY